MVEQVLCCLGRPQPWFWASHDGGELDLLIEKAGRRIGFEMKFSEAPAVSRSMRNTAETLALDHLFVVCPARREYAVDQGISVLPATRIPALPSIIAALP